MWPFDPHSERGARRDPAPASPAGAAPDADIALMTGPGAPADDATLLRRVAAGEESALAALYDRWAATIHALARRVVREPSEADEVVEDTFWQVWRQAGRYDAARGSASAWLLTIARSRALDRRRARARLREEADDAPEAIAEVAAESGRGPYEAAEAADRSRVVRAALAELPEEQRETLELAYYSGLSQTEIAERTGTPLGTVKTRMRLALHKLRDRLAGHAEALA